MVNADETVLATATNTTSISSEPMEPKSSDESTDSETDKIEIMKAGQRDVFAESTISSEVNGNEENGHSETAVETAVETAESSVTEITTVETTTAETTTLETTTVMEEAQIGENGNSATTSEPVVEKETTEEEIQDVVMEAAANEENGTELTEVTESTKIAENGTKPEENKETDVVVVLDDDEPVPELISADPETATTNGVDASKEEKEQSGKGVKRPVELIQLDDDDDDIQEVSAPAPAKKPKVEEDQKEVKPDLKVADDNEKAQMRLLDKLQEYVKEQKDQTSSKGRKVLDTLLGAINAQVQKEPLSVRKLILDKVLVLPNTISFPPSQVCDLLIEHDPEMPIAKVINRMFGDEKPKLSDSEKRERALLKQHNPVPNMTKLLVDIGQDLVQEATYCDIVHAKNLPETPKNLETYKQ
ncbi:hypothetical protein CRE_11627, partial [Caenorhabditis remanei]